jgi:hypothetical protein
MRKESIWAGEGRFLSLSKGAGLGTNTEPGDMPQLAACGLRFIHKSRKPCYTESLSGRGNMKTIDRLNHLNDRRPVKRWRHSLA